MIDVATVSDPSEKWLSASKIVGQIPGPPVHPATVRRWSRIGINGEKLLSFNRRGRIFYRLTDVMKFLGLANDVK